MSADKVNENLLGCLVALLLMPVFIGLRGWVLATLWRWLVVPTFGVHAVSVWQAIGLSVIVSLLTMKTPEDDDDSVLETTIRTAIYAVLAYSVSLALGWIVSYQI